MSRQKNEYVPFGELLLKARLEKELSRADLAKLTGISENSLLRYEKAGLDPDGQFPPGPKLAALCFELEISPLLALLGCLPYEESWGAKGKVWEDDLLNHPDYTMLSDDYLEVLKQNRKLRLFIKGIMANSDDLNDDQLEALERLTPWVEKVIAGEDAIDKEWADRGMPEFRYVAITAPGIPQKHWERLGIGPYSKTAQNEKNGSDLKGPSRSRTNATAQKAVSAASTKPEKDRTDEAD